MQTIKCDRCLKSKKSNLKNDKWVRFNFVGPYFYENFDVCDKCAPRLVNYVKKYLKKKNKKQ